MKRTQQPSSVTSKTSRTCGLVLSLYPGAGLLDAGFTNAGFSVVRGPDLLYGQDTANFHIDESHFQGIIAGPPCQDFSRARRRPPTGYSLKQLRECCRLITEGQPDWWLIENVPGIPSLQIPGYVTQRFNLFASEFGLKHKRNRTFQFGSRGESLTILRRSQSQRLKPTPLASTGSRHRRANFADYCEKMGLPRSFNLPGLARTAKYRAIGNGVPVPVAYAVACAIRDRAQSHPGQSHCPCNCGRVLTGKQTTATAACRKRLQRRRQHQGPVTLNYPPAASHSPQVPNDRNSDARSHTTPARASPARAQTSPATKPTTERKVRK